MEDPLCNSSFGSMVTLDYVNPVTPFAEKYMSIVLAMEAGVASGHARQSRASHGDDWPPLRGHDGHLHSGAFPTALEEIRCGTSPAVCSSSCFQITKRTSLRIETLDFLDRSLATEKHTRVVLAIEGLEGLNKIRASHGGDWAPFRGRDCHLSSFRYCWRWLAKSSNTGSPSDSSGSNMVRNFTVFRHAEFVSASDRLLEFELRCWPSVPRDVVFHRCRSLNYWQT